MNKLLPRRGTAPSSETKEPSVRFYATAQTQRLSTLDRNTRHSRSELLLVSKFQFYRVTFVRPNFLRQPPWDMEKPRGKSSQERKAEETTSVREWDGAESTQGACTCLKRDIQLQRRNVPKQNSNGTNASNVHFGTNASSKDNRQTSKESRCSTTFVHGDRNPSKGVRAPDIDERGAHSAL